MTQDTSATITLKKPLKRGEQEIAKLKLRKPDTGSLRGCRLSMLLNSDVDSLVMLLPRITEPALTEHDISQMDVKDLVSCASEVVGFLTE
ncbi:phage tail assembly protein [Zhongshania borealis]|uniref:Phage tail assembly protein n=1 Tax=Zhongshania borealis TaxID=889488 RepID=A0ABP7WEG2_9GAMM